jgi:hypothetical protein
MQCAKNVMVERKKEVTRGLVVKGNYLLFIWQYLKNHFQNFTSQ